jgi:hypothetical protein
MRWAYVVLVLGLTLCLVGAFLMVAGEPVLGENHAGIAAVVGIVGIGFIGTSGAMLSARAMLKPKNYHTRTLSEC